MDSSIVLKEKLPGVYFNNELVFKEVFSCDFDNHSPPKHDLLIEDICNIRVPNPIVTLKKFESMIMNSDSVFNVIDSFDSFQGFLVCEGGTLCKKARAPLMGFCIQKGPIKDMLSPYTNELLKKYGIAEPSNNEKKVIGAHSFRGVHVIHTSMFKFLTETFEWEHKPVILHALLWKSKFFEKKYVNFLLKKRQSIIEKLKVCKLEEQMSLSILKSTIKLILCSSYGYCSLNSGDTSTKYKKSCFVNWTQLRKKLNKQHQLVTAVPIENDLYEIFFQPKKNIEPLLSHGAAILSMSKVIFLNSIYFLLSHLSPNMAQILYCDTDSIHLAVCEENICENVPHHLKKSYKKQEKKFFDEKSAPSGILILESSVDYEKVFAEKAYILKVKSNDEEGQFVTDSSIKSQASKGIPHSIKIHSNIDSCFGFQQNQMRRLEEHKGVGICAINKTFGGLLIPRRRYFLKESFSFPFLYGHRDRGVSATKKQNPISWIPEVKTKKKLNPNQNSKSSLAIQKKDENKSVFDKMINIPSTCDIIDNAYRLKRKSNDDLTYVYPKKLKKSMYIEHEVIEAKNKKRKV